ncbi:MAG: serine hydrolase [Candidatus Promineifilaceae bacterium]
MQPSQRHRLILFSLLLILAACREPAAPTAVSSPTLSPLSSTATSLPTEVQETPSSLLEPTSIVTSPVPTATSATQLSVSSNITPCGVILPVLSQSTVPVTAELPEVEIPDTVPEDVRPALQRLLDAPDTVGLAAYQIGYEADGVYLNADVPMPLASVVKIINLIAYAEGANDGQFNPAEWIPLSELERYYLPGTDLSSHRLALQDLEERSLIALDPPATPLEEIPWMMTRYSSNAAADYLHMAVGQQTIEETAVSLGLTTQTAPCPFIGEFLAMSNHEREGSDQQAIEGYLADPAFYGEEVMRLTELYAGDETFRQNEINLRGQSPSLPVQSFFSENLLAEASAGDYANLMAQILNNEIGDSYVNILVRRNLEWPMLLSGNQELFTTIGYKNGAFPGILTTVYYAQRLEDGGRVVVALFYRNLPDYLYRSWRRNLPHDAFAHWLLSDPQAIPTIKTLLSQ